MAGILGIMLDFGVFFSTVIVLVMFLMSMFLCHLPMEGFLCSQRSTSWSWSSETFPAEGWALSQQTPRNGYPFLKHGLNGCLVRR